MIGIGIGIGISLGSGMSRGGVALPRITLSATTIAENASIGSVVGALGVANGSGSYTFSITADPDSKFAVDGSNLETAATLNYEAKASHLVTIEADNGVDGPISLEIEIFVTNVLEVTLNALSLDADEIDEGDPEDTVVGAVVGKSSGSTLSLIDTAGGRFKLSGANIVAGATPTDYETAASHNITLRETHADGSNSPRDTVIAITVLNVGDTSDVYYVDPAGSDSNDGLTEGTAWATLAKVAASTFAPGSQILFKGGAVFQGELSLIEGRHFGEPGNPVTFGSYGTGKALIEATDNAHRGVYALNPHDIIIEDLSFEGTGSAVSTASGISCLNDLLSDSKLPGLVIRRNTVFEYGVNGIEVGIGLTAEAAQSASGFDGAVVEDNIVHDCTGNAPLYSGNGISIQGLYGLADYDASHLAPVVRGNTVYNCTGKADLEHHSGNGIILGQCDGGTVEYNLAYNNGEESNHASGPVGIWCYDSTGVIIQFNVARGNKTATGAADGGGFGLDGGCVGCVLQYNYAQGNDGAGFQLYQYSDAAIRPMSGNIVRYNISENDGQQPAASKGSITIGCEDDRDQEDNVFYGNTVYKDVASGNAVSLLGDHLARFISGGFANNILIIAGASARFIDNEGSATIPSTFLWRGNLYRTTVGISIKWNGTTYTSFAAWRAASGAETDGGDTSVVADPLMVGPLPVGAVDVYDDAALAAYQTDAESPARGAGQDISTLFGLADVADYFGGSTPDGASDIGAFDGAEPGSPAFIATYHYMGF